MLTVSRKSWLEEMLRRCTLNKIKGIGASRLFGFEDLLRDRFEGLGADGQYRFQGIGSE